MIRAYLGRLPLPYSLSLLFGLLVGLTFMLLGLLVLFGSGGSSEFRGDSTGNLLVIILAVALLAGVGTYTLAARTGIASILTVYGEARQLIPAIDAELADPSRVIVVGDPIETWDVEGVRTRVLLTPSWVLQFDTDSKLTAAPLDDVYWVSRVQRLANQGLTRVQVRMRQGISVSLMVPDGQADELLNAFFRRLPWVLSGENRDWDDAWRHDRAALGREVEQQRERVVALDDAARLALVRKKIQSVRGGADGPGDSNELPPKGHRP
jgi:hypothetical protein